MGRVWFKNPKKEFCKLAKEFQKKKNQICSPTMFRIIQNLENFMQRHPVDSEKNIFKISKLIVQLKKTFATKNYFFLFFFVLSTEALNFNHSYIKIKWVHNYRSLLHTFAFSFVSDILLIWKRLSLESDSDQRENEKRVFYGQY